MSKSHKTEWNDLLFENRNKAYGAYVIRKQEGSNLMKSLGLVVVLLGILLGGLSFIDKEDPEIIICELYPTEHNLKKISEVHLVIPPKTDEKQVKAAPKMKNADSNTMPTPKEETTIESPINKKDDIGKIEGPEESGDNTDVKTGTGTENNNSTVVKPEGDENSTEIKDDSNDIFMARDVSKMVIFPGCEKSKTDKKSLQDCMSKKLETALADELADFAQIAEKRNISSAQAKLNFVINKKGEIIGVKVQGSNEMFNLEAKKALEKVAKKLQHKGRFIQAAELNDGTKVNMNFSFPLNYSLN